MFKKLMAVVFCLGLSMSFGSMPLHAAKQPGLNASQFASEIEPGLDQGAVQAEQLQEKNSQPSWRWLVPNVVLLALAAAYVKKYDNRFGNKVYLAVMGLYWAKQVTSRLMSTLSEL